MDKKEINNLLEKYRNRTISPEEEQMLLDILAANHLSTLFSPEEMEADLDTDDNDCPEQIEESLSSIKASLRTRIYHPERRRNKIIYRAAACIAFLMILFGGARIYQFYTDSKAARIFVVVEAPLDRVKKVPLTDGSVITISPGSVIAYPKVFSEREREVDLRVGTAFFEVAKDSHRQFNVRFGKYQTTALGTSFTVEYNPVFKWGKVNLYTGKVKVGELRERSGLKPVFLMPGESFENSGEKIVRGHFLPDTANPVLRGLNFERTPFNEAIPLISSWYRVKIHYDSNATRSLSLNGNFNGQSLSDILSAIAFIHKLKIKRTDTLNYSIMK